MNANALLAPLAALRAHAGTRRTQGLDDATLLRLAANHPELAQAIAAAAAEYERVRAEFADLLDLDEDAQIARRAGRLRQLLPGRRGQSVRRARRARPVGRHAQGRGAARLRRLRHARLRPHARSGARRDGAPAGDGQHHDAERCRSCASTARCAREIGHTRGGCPYDEVPVPELRLGIGVAGRAHRRRQHQADDRSGRPPRRPRDQARRGQGQLPRPHRAPGAVFGFLAQDLPCSTWPASAARTRCSRSSRTTSTQLQAGLRRRRRQRLVHRGDVPRAGDGRRRPGPQRAAGVLRRRARADPKAHGSLLLVDSIQAGLRAHGVLSIVDYPGFERLDAPDMETYSKALNAGQYPLSVLAVDRARRRACTARACTATR